MKLAHAMVDFILNIPLPTLETSFTAKMINRCHEIPGKHTSNATASMKYARTFGQFVLAIPRSNNVLHAWVKRTFGEACTASVSDLRYYDMNDWWLPTNEKPQNIDLLSAICS